MLQETPKNVGGAGKQGGGRKSGSKKIPLLGEPPTLADLGLDKKTSSIAQKLAALPVRQFEQVKAGAALKFAASPQYSLSGY